MDQVSMENNSWFLIIQAINSLKLWKVMLAQKSQVTDAPHTQSSLGQLQTAWIGLSKDTKQRSQVWSYITLRRTKLHLLCGEFSFHRPSS